MLSSESSSSSRWTGQPPRLCSRCDLAWRAVRSAPSQSQHASAHHGALTPTGTLGPPSQSRDSEGGAVPACKSPPRRPYRYARPLPSPETRRGGGPSPLKAAPERAAGGGRRSGRLEDQPRCPVGTNRGNRGTNSGNHGTVGRTVGRSARGTNRGNRGTSPCLTNRVASSAGSRNYSRLRVGERIPHSHTRSHSFIIMAAGSRTYR